MSLSPDILLEAFFVCIQFCKPRQFVVMASDFRRVRIYSVGPTGQIFVKFGVFKNIFRDTPSLVQIEQEYRALNVKN
jgi:hypothetical protein